MRIRNGEVCYWPNLGYGRFGAKVTMDHAPRFDHPDQFDHKRIRLADIDGTGTTDIIYLHRDGVRLYFNQSGNSWSAAAAAAASSRAWTTWSSIVPTDLLGNGTACLVWSSPLPGDARRPMRYVDLMGGQKPHLLVKTINNLGAETRVQYAPSTKFYLQDKRDGKPWITRLPFPVHVVERVETYDHISRNRFVTRYAYHHGYFDGEEREFRGFGMVEQWDTEEFAALTGDGTLPAATNIDAASHVPPVLTKTWFHTGVYLGRDHVSDFFAGLLDAEDNGEYYREPGLTDAQAQAAAARRHRAARRLDARGRARSLPRPQGLDAAPGGLCPRRHATRSSIPTPSPSRTSPSGCCSRAAATATRCSSPTPARPSATTTSALVHATRTTTRSRRMPTASHADAGGGSLRQCAESSRHRLRPAPARCLAAAAADRDKQTETAHHLHREPRSPTDRRSPPDDYRTPLPCETRTYELTGFTPTSDAAARFSFD